MFEDALEEVEEAKEDVCINNNNINNSGSKSKIKFKLPRKSKKSREKSLEEEEEQVVVSLEEGLVDAQRAIDLFFDNQFEESREVAQTQ